MNRNILNSARFVFACFTLSIFANSCKKSDGSDNSAARQYLTRFVQFIDLWPAGADTVYTYDYTYDVNKRLSRVVTRYFSNAGVLGYIKTENRYYNGTDTLPFKCVIQSSLANGAEPTYIHLLTYDGSGNIIRDSIEHYTQQSIEHYFYTDYYYRSYNNTIRLRMSNNGQGGYQIADSTYTTEHVINGNLARHEDTGSFYPPPPFPPTPTVSYFKYEAYSYDTKNNPFRPLLLHYPYYNYPGGSFSRSINNPTYFSTKYNNGSTNETYLNYSYNSAGYPDSATGNTGLASGRYKYFYSSL